MVIFFFLLNQPSLAFTSEWDKQVTEEVVESQSCFAPMLLQVHCPALFSAKLHLLPGVWVWGQRSTGESQRREEEEEDLDVTARMYHRASTTYVISCPF